MRGEGTGLGHLLGRSRRLAVVDVETTGLSRLDEVAEIAVVVLDGAAEEVAAWESLVRPSVPLSDGAARVNGLRQADLADAPTFADLAGDLARLLHGACIAAHNAAFDLRMLGAAFDRVGSRLTVDRPIDTYRLTRMTLERSLASHRVPAVDLHRAMGDVRATIGLIRRIAVDLEPGSPARISPLPARTGVTPVVRDADRGPAADPRPGTPRTPRRRQPGERVNMGRRASGRTGGANVDMDDASLLRAARPVDVQVDLPVGGHVVISTLSQHSKAEVTAHATGLGLVVKPEVSKQTVLLITDDLDSPSRRARKARELRVPIALAADLLACRDGQALKARGDAG